jgi:DNA-binding MarR family transcriptional regulator
MVKDPRENAIDELFRSLVAFGRTTRALAQTWSSSQPDLSRNDVVALGVLAESGTCRPSALAEHLGVGPSVVSRQVAHLQDLGLVARETDPDDGRAGLVSLTDAGRDRLLAGRRAYLERLSDRLSDWDEQRLRAAADLLEELTGQLAARPTTVKEPA